MSNNLKHISKFLSLVLRHKPEEIDLILNEQGWANVNELIKKLNNKGEKIDFATLEQVVITNDKKRFAFNEEKTMIRASQGHSLEVELELKATIPPVILYHGTATRFLDKILIEGLKKQQRQHVHLSATKETAVNVGSRHGKPVVLVIDAAAMIKEGFLFYLSANNVWLTNEVPPKFITP